MKKKNNNQILQKFNKNQIKIKFLSTRLYCVQYRNTSRNGFNF